MPSIAFSKIERYFSSACRNSCSTRLSALMSCSVERIPRTSSFTSEKMSLWRISTVPVLMRHKLIFSDVNDEVRGMRSTLQDISALKRVEQELRQAEEKYRSIFENAIEGIFQTTPDGRFQSANPALARIYGYRSSDEMIRQLSDIERQLYVDPNRRKEFVQLLQ